MSKNFALDDESFDNTMSELKSKKFKKLESSINDNNKEDNNNNKKQSKKQDDWNEDDSNTNEGTKNKQKLKEERSHSNDSGKRDFLNNYKTVNTKRGKNRFKKESGNRQQTNKRSEKKESDLKQKKEEVKEDDKNEKTSTKLDSLKEEKFDVFSLMNNTEPKRTIVSEKTKRYESGIVGKMQNGQIRTVGGFYTHKDRQISEIKLDFLQGDKQFKGCGRILNKCTSLFVTNRSKFKWIKSESTSIEEMYLDSLGKVLFKNIREFYREEDLMCCRITSVFSTEEELFVWDEEDQLFVITSPSPPLFVQLKLVSNEVNLLTKKELTESIISELKVVCDKKELLTNSGLKQPFTYDLIDGESVTDFELEDLIDTKRKEEDKYVSLTNLRPIMYCSTEALLRLNSRLEKDFK